MARGHVAAQSGDLVLMLDIAYMYVGLTQNLSHRFASFPASDDIDNICTGLL